MLSSSISNEERIVMLDGLVIGSEEEELSYFTKNG